MIEALKLLLKQASSARSRGEAAEAERLFKEAAAQARRDKGDRVGAAIYYAEAITLFRTVNATTLLAHALRHAAEIRSEMKEYGVAGTQIEESLRLYRSLQYADDAEAEPLDLANALRVSALNDERRALQAWAEAEQLYAAAHVDAGVTESQQHLQRLAATTQEHTA